MQKKLTLRMDHKVIERGKSYAKARGKSVSQLVADYFRALSRQPKKRKGPGGKSFRPSPGA